jgi:hypothetical protein
MNQPLSAPHTMTTATSADQTVMYNPYMGAMQPIREVCVFGIYFLTTLSGNVSTPYTVQRSCVCVCVCVTNQFSLYQ